ncbi:EKC/KEOPS complex subunit TP53RK [Dendroctonus ponderosae]|uniref:non-specific serine/threonine protein kinase n=1 Tax=Dendroctonus ponderosae TaxID=77166 RepID=J3JW11_DENPD|nr:EKC/KEOPS complex subunit TP53RK [Dendroctonus ponderosae]AEE62391.1 unknown [Dendroctonus ponderosae]
MEGFKLIKQGAEAKLYQGVYLGVPTIIKERFVKTYRHKHLDDSLTKERMRAEAKALVRCKTVGIATPMLLNVDFHTRMIFMEHFVHSITLKDFIEQTCLDTLLELSVLIGKTLGKMHAGSIIHGDLTSSNILLVNTSNKDCFEDLQELKLVLIDFGLAHIEPCAEDKGVDLYVLERALLSTHAVAEAIFPSILEGYKQSYKNGFREVFCKYEEVRARGRKRTMVG